MQHTGTHKLVKATTAAVAAALLAVPVAQARLDVDAHHGALSNRHAVHQPLVKTDARHSVPLGKAGVTPLILQERRLSKIEKMHSRLGKLDLPTAATVSTASTVSTGFDWNDAGVGAGVAFGLVLLATGGVLVTRRRLVGA
ncbi:MAG TPA: hypothetical protein VGJ49_01790 [Gaiellaceae bacterium]